MLAVLLSGLTACGASTKFNNPQLSVTPVLTPAPAELARDCKAPGKLPEVDTTQEDAEALWSADRAALVDCRKRKRAEGSYYRKRDAAIAGASSAAP